jgi:hypothetical protein
MAVLGAWLALDVATEHGAAVLELLRHLLVAIVELLAPRVRLTAENLLLRQSGSVSPYLCALSIFCDNLPHLDTAQLLRAAAIGPRELRFEDSATRVRKRFNE